MLTKVQAATSEEFDALFGEIAAGPPAGIYAGPGGAAAGTTELQPGSERLLARIDEWQGAAYRHGEQLSLRFFSHVGEASSQTFAT